MKESGTLVKGLDEKREAYKPSGNLFRLISFIFLLLLLIVSVLLSVKAFTSSEIGPDAGYYLSVAARIADGYIPYKNLFLEYPPVGMYFYALAAAVTPSFKYENYYLINYLFLLGISGVVYLIAVNLVSNRLLAAIAGVFTLALSLYCQGYVTLLEPFTVFFYMLAIYLVIRGIQTNKNWRFFLAGGLIFLSFFSKQFGLLVLPAIFVYVLMSSYSPGRKVMINLIMFAGFCLFAALIGAYYILNGVAMSDLVAALSGSGAGKGAYGVRSVTEMVKAIIAYIIRAELFLLIVPVLLFLDRRFRTNKHVIMLLMLNLCAFLPLYFADFTHYYQLIVPFSVLLGIYLVNYAMHRLPGKVAYLSLGAVFLSVLFTIGLLYKISFQFEQTGYRYTRKEQLKIAGDLQRAAPPRSQVFLAGAEEMYALCNYLPLNPEKYGYMFQIWFSPEEIVRSLKPGQFLIFPEYNFERYKPHVGSLTEIPVNKEFYVFRRD